MNVAVVGATGAVGTSMLRVLSERGFPADEVRPLASSRSAGRKVQFGDSELTVQELNEDNIQSLDLALFSAGGSGS